MIYAELCKRYQGLTPQVIADMTPHQQLTLYAPDQASDTLYFANHNEYQKWLTSRR